ncbi:MAG: SIMPL domain-containing protein [Nanoarchaeota archaeon]
MKGNSLITGIAIIGLVIAVLVLAFRPSVIDGGNVVPGEKNTISATGVAEATVIPDLAVVYISVETLKDTADESKNENSVISDRVLASLEVIGIDDGDIETLNYNIYPEYDWSVGKQKLKGYRTSNTIKVETENFDLIGRVIDVSVDAGANRIDNIQFEMSPEKESEAKKEALEKASRDAREKAEATASGLNVRLGKIVSVSAQDYYYMPYPFFKGGMVEEAREAVAAAPDIRPGELETSATVSVVFEIK